MLSSAMLRHRCRWSTMIRAIVVEALAARLPHATIASLANTVEALQHASAAGPINIVLTDFDRPHVVSLQEREIYTRLA